VRDFTSYNRLNLALQTDDCRDLWRQLAFPDKRSQARLSPFLLKRKNVSPLYT
jgi:hypothetical protein